MLVPTEEELRLDIWWYPSIHGIPHYGTRGWCRVEYFIFMLYMAMTGREEDVPLYSIARDGRLHHGPPVGV